MARIQHLLAEANKQQVIRLLNWTDMQYCIYQQNKGYEYMRQVIGSDELGVRYLAKNALFWKWWINHWNRRDEEWLGYAASAPARHRENLYRDLHSINGCEFYPHRLIMETSYDNLIKDLTEKSSVQLIPQL